MKKFILILLVLLLIAPSAFAMSCKVQQGQGADECWTNVAFTMPDDTNVYTRISRGTVLVYNSVTADNANDAAVRVMPCNASTDSYRVAGVAQQDYDWSSGDRTGVAMVRGKGFVRMIGGYASFDRIWASGNAKTPGAGAVYEGVSTTSVASHDKPIGFMLTAGADATADAYITVV